MRAQTSFLMPTLAARPLQLSPQLILSSPSVPGRTAAVLRPRCQQCYLCTLSTQPRLSPPLLLPLPLHLHNSNPKLQQKQTENQGPVRRQFSHSVRGQKGTASASLAQSTATSTDTNTQPSTMAAAKTNITVIGAGVIGLTNAMLLSRNPQYQVTVVAKFMPGDYDIEYASPWAGANYLPFAPEGSSNAALEQETWAELERLARDEPAAGIHFQDVLLLNHTGEKAGGVVEHLMSQSPWYKDVVPGWRALEASELPAGVASGTTFKSVCINTAIYLPWLASQCLRQGVVIRRGIVTHVADPARQPARTSFSHDATTDAAAIVVNCTGLGAKFLDGVADETLYPVRGQIVVVRNSAGGNMYTLAGDVVDEDGVRAEQFTYAMERAAGGGTILGGCAQAHKWDSQPDMNLAQRIMQRCVDACPALVPPGSKGVEGLSIIRHGVGLRPVREDGIRVEADRVDGVHVVHCYGHGGYGYQTSYGSARKCVDLVDAIVRQQ